MSNISHHNENEKEEDEEENKNKCCNNSGQEDDIIVVDRLLNGDLDRCHSPNKVEQNLVCCGRNLNVTRSQLIVLCLIIPYIFLTSSYYSLFAPFLPG